MKIALLILAKLAGTVLAADFVGGVVHWLEDAYVREDTPWIGRIVARPNIVHHHYPRYMTRHSWWQTSRDLAILSALLVMAAWFSRLSASSRQRRASFLESIFVRGHYSIASGFKDKDDCF